MRIITNDRNIDIIMIKKQVAKVISTLDLPDFSRTINEFLAKGYKIQSSYLGPERYAAIMIGEDDQ
jgi:hypothetical protein